ncbi:polysaccharide deacetylase family protein [Rhodococcus sp. 14C212]|uniref:polysaccharide deacetylase family protein n=1 Tax=Rhodococcus sp. 14C212 TaxID=2711209 RepID=UPI0013EBE47F|nr:polysaccharide deacetylase family protein [Rhodococcus sp. 14C212]NGP07219.1 polysaccharide deacetylase family protein [Rhodococcus sp. 14C212]
MNIRFRRGSLVVAASILVVTACGSGPPDEPPETTATSSPTSEPATTLPRPSSPVPAPAPSATLPAPSSGPVPVPPAGVPAALRGIDLERIPTEEKVVALTFDGGASDTAVSRILATLARYDVPATFFVTGDFARTYPDRVRALAAAGHSVGNHSNTHPSYPDLIDEQIRADLAAAESAITALTGRPAVPLFRFPFGARTDADIRVVNGAGYVPVRWTVDSLGWKGTSGGLDAAAVTERVLAAAAPGQIVLLHVGANPDDGTTLDADALPAIIDGLRTRGYGFVDLADVVR